MGNKMTGKGNGEGGWRSDTKTFDGMKLGRTWRNTQLCLMLINTLTVPRFELGTIRVVTHALVN